jgi:DNA-binding CsgD family transcriptional regulator
MEPAMAAPRRTTLTPREREVIALVADGLTTRQIARRLTLSEHTVGMFIRRLMHVLNAHSRAHAVALAYRRGILQRCD